MFASLRSRLVLSNLLISLLGLLAVVFVFTQLLAQNATDIKRRELETQAQNLAGQVHQSFVGRVSRQSLIDRIDTASNLLHERIIVASPTGRLIFDSANRTPFYKTLLFTPADLNSEQTVASLKCQKLICFRRPVQGTHGHLHGGDILIVAQPADIRPTHDYLLSVILIAAGAALIAWLIVGLFSTYSIFRPLRRITAATERMAQGDYSARVGSHGQGEIRQLAVSFDGMAGQVQQTNQVLKDFLANVSHDLRTPLTMIAGFSQALLDGTATPADTGESAAVIHEEALRMQRLVDDLLQLTRLESGLLTLECHPIEVRAFAQRVLDRAGRALDRELAAALQIAVAADLPPIDVDPERLERALRNLVDNALEYTPIGGQVTIGARPASSGWVEMYVKDSGAGIPPADLPRIFERFYRSDKSRERIRGHGHSGLGLAIVREIVEAHGGEVWVESELNRGTTFHFTVRAAGRAAAGKHRQIVEEPAPEAVVR